MMEHLFFFLGLAFLCMHEMDAIRCREWRIFPLLSLLNDRWGMAVFQLAHVPLFTWVFWELAQPDLEAKASFMWGFDVFMMVHLVLHLLFLMHKKNEFTDWISWTLIVAAAVCGGLDLML